MRGGRNFGHLAYRGRRHLRDLPAADGRRRDDQPPAARRPHGLRPLARRRSRSSCCRKGRRSPRPSPGVDAQHRRMVMLEIVAVPAFTDNYSGWSTTQTSGETAVVDPGDAAPVAGRSRAARLDDQPGAGTRTGTPTTPAATCAIKEATGARISGPGGRDHPGPRRRAVPKATSCRIGDHVGRVIEIPGHTLGHIALIFDDDRIAFVGDTLFAMGCGRLFEGTPQQMYRIAPAACRAARRHRALLRATNIRSPTRASRPRRARQSGDRRAARARSRRCATRARSPLPTTVAAGTRNQSLRSRHELEEFARLRADKDSFRS